jgi:hypothetical protein
MEMTGVVVTAVTRASGRAEAPVSPASCGSQMYSRWIAVALPSPIRLPARS